MASLKGDFLGDIPTNLIALMGISYGSAVTASSTRALQSSGKSPYKGKPRAWGLLSSESDPKQLSLPKLQMFFWTIVAVLIYVVIIANYFQVGNASLPDPGTGLVALMGISHGAYLGNKFSDNPQESGQIAEFTVSQGSKLISQAPKGVQSQTGMPYVVGVVRADKLQDLTDPTLTIQANDVLLAYGDSTQLNNLENQV
jgi:hypothetical protein